MCTGQAWVASCAARLVRHLGAARYQCPGSVHAIAGSPVTLPRASAAVPVPPIAGPRTLSGTQAHCRGGPAAAPGPSGVASVQQAPAAWSWLRPSCLAQPQMAITVRGRHQGSSRAGHAQYTIHYSSIGDAVFRPVHEESARGAPTCDSAMPLMCVAVGAPRRVRGEPAAVRQCGSAVTPAGPREAAGVISRIVASAGAVGQERRTSRLTCARLAVVSESVKLQLWR